MRVLVLSPYPERIAPAIEASGDEVIAFNGPPADWPEADYVVSFGYRHIIREPLLSKYRGRLINIHISRLPWNRGADPNFWSWFDGTPKGVSIHRVDAGVDTGAVLAHQDLTEDFSARTCLTLRSSYELLLLHAERLFAETWPALRNDTDIGTEHRKADIEPWLPKLSNGWDTPVSEVEELGREYRKIAS